MSTFNDLQTVGINPFAVTLLAESVLKSPLAPMTVGKPQRIAFPISRGDCAGWAGVRITIEAVPEADRDAPWPPAPTTAKVEALTAERDRLAAELDALRTVEQAARAYFDHYLQDEAEHVDCCICGDEQHSRAKLLRWALKAAKSAALGTSNAAPMRAVRLTMKVDADDMRELSYALRNIADHAERGELTTGMSGGPSSGYIYELLQDPSMTHDVYHAALRAYLDRLKRVEG